MFNRDFIFNLFKVILLILLQVVIFDHIEVMGKAQPFFYVVFVVFYPQLGNKYALLLLSFILGFGIDFVQQTGGIHTFSLLSIAFLRNKILRLITGQDADEYDRYNTYDLSALQWFTLTILLIIIHHIFLFVLENFKLTHLGEVLISAILSSILTFIFVFIYKILFRRKVTL
ncbi:MULTISPECIES: rod shape-determining protein MreD [Weeksella]|uniref:rod shape-determining protein MreD n=1 Tax=Weeksella TaxID=1013 RepID=UPI0008A3556F|nr:MULTISPECIES: rod shape-determining protein MreD [Weeksella]MDK7374854.1 rod shape-determining protein MreD [Weeksella virosa]OFM83947.1 rod shape-determining protein MreD [Weeksella sp. HMSC059D05]